MLLASLADRASGFAELRRQLGISDSMLSARLAELTEAGLVERSVSEGPPVAVTYRLTHAGEALVPALRSLSQWARANLG